MERAYAEAYEPFLSCLEKYPAVRLTAHFSGCLAEWLDRRDPEFFSRWRRQVEAGRAEFLTGGYYEPILCAIPERDAVGQIRQMSAWLKRRIGVSARGLWLAERVWEPHLPRILREAGVEFTAVDDTHFEGSGLAAADLRGYYRTDAENGSVAVFPISRRLRYLIPFAPPEEVLEHLRNFATEEGNGCLVMWDDGEKFGLWPGTREHCYGSAGRAGWLERFFRLLTENPWVRMSLPSEVLSELSPQGRVYLPASSYFEMSEWALPAETAAAFEEGVRRVESVFPSLARFLRGGFWRNFLAKYPEANHLHKKMLEVSRKADSRKSAVRRHLWAGQCNCAYWHGVFGGLYLPHLRQAMYEHLIRAEALSDGRIRPRLRLGDFDMDGREEAILESECLSAWVSPAWAGSLVELDDRRAGVNWLDTLSRRPEAYHDKIRSAGKPGGVGTIHGRYEVKEEGLSRWLVYDNYRRTSALDRLQSAGSASAGGGSLLEAAVLSDGWRMETTSAEVRLNRPLPENGKISKTFQMSDPRTLEIQVRLESGAAVVRYAMEWNLSFSRPADSACFLEINGVRGDPPEVRAAARHENVRTFRAVDEARNSSLAFEVDPPVALHRYPVETVSLSEAGMERTYQATCLVLEWPDPIPADRPFHATLRVQVHPQPNPPPTPRTNAPHPLRAAPRPPEGRAGMGGRFR